MIDRKLGDDLLLRAGIEVQPDVTRRNAVRPEPDVYLLPARRGLGQGVGHLQ